MPKNYHWLDTDASSQWISVNISIVNCIYCIYFIYLKNLHYNGKSSEYCRWNLLINLKSDIEGQLFTNNIHCNHWEMGTFSFIYIWVDQCATKPILAWCDRWPWLNGLKNEIWLLPLLIFLFCNYWNLTDKIFCKVCCQQRCYFCFKEIIAIVDRQTFLDIVRNICFFY